MKKTDMLYIKNSRENILGFLHYSEQIELDNLLANEINVDISKMAFWDLCDLVIKAYDEKYLNRKNVSRAFEILASANTHIRIESHRIRGREIFEFDEDANAYIYLKDGSVAEFNALNHYL